MNILNRDQMTAGFQKQLKSLYMLYDKKTLKTVFYLTDIFSITFPKWFLIQSVRFKIFKDKPKANIPSLRKRARFIK